ncbi:MAG: hypothetical protein MPW15_16240 [Candidatus Manganitrophus sp.]|nr:hypothetical protein [Candidatus Manganitrophus sp.]
MAELIGGIEPARELILAAIDAGKHVVTANKALIAHHGNEIFEAAAVAQAGRSASRPPWRAASRSSTRPSARAWPATASTASPASSTARRTTS